MALLLNDDDKVLQNGQEPQDGTQSLGGSMPAPVGGSSGPATVAGSGIASKGVSTAGVGAGGTGWTNIQAYLNANKDNTTSSKLVDNVGTGFDTERSKLQTEADEAKTKSFNEAEKTNLSTDTASKLVTEAAQAGRGTDIYGNNTGRVKGVLNAKYEGPQDFNFTRNAQNQDYGSRLGQDDQFSGVMENLYRGATGGRITQGQLNLQKQLDVGGAQASALQDARSRALTKYAGLDSDFNSLVPSTNEAIKAQIKRFGEQQSGVQTGLQNDEVKTQAELQSLADAWNAQQQARVAAKPNHGDAQWLGYKDSAGNAGTRKVAHDPFYKYDAGDTAAKENVGGGKQQRDVWNTIADVLGRNSSVAEPTAPLRESSWSFDNRGLSDAITRANSELAAANYDVMPGTFQTEQEALLKAQLANRRITEGDGYQGDLGEGGLAWSIR